MRKNIVFILFSLFCNNFITAQNQANIWYFGHYTGLDFNGDTTKVIESFNSTMSYGVATICNTSGEILFSINDRSQMYNYKHELVKNFIINKQHQIVKTSILPHPQNKNAFYIFTVQRQSSSYHYPPLIKKDESYNKHFTQGFSRVGAEHSITSKSSAVSMTFHLYYTNVVVNTNKEITFLEQNRKLYSFKTLTPSMQAIRHQEGYSLLVLDGAEAMLKVYNVDVNGFEQKPRQISLRNIIDLQDYEKGYITLKTVNKTGDKILLYTDSDINKRSRNFYYLMNFDYQNHTLSKIAKIAKPKTLNTSNAEFSPNSSKLYINGNGVKTENGVRGNSLHILYQYDLSSSNEQKILASKIKMMREYKFSGIGETDVYDLQLAPDGKIYGVSLYRYMYSINNPDAKGEGCDWEQKAIDLKTSKKIRGHGGAVLPNITHLLGK